MNFGQSCLSGCAPTQVLTINLAINDLSAIEVLNDCSKVYDKSVLQYSYSTDSLCWSCYGTYDEILENVIELISDFYVRIKVSGVINGVKLNGENFYDYSTQIASGFNFAVCDTSNTNSNIYNPYANMDCAIGLQQQLTETVSCVFGIPCYYFKVNGVAGSEDITFKEYALKSVTAVKQIKIIIADGKMPSSKPEFSDFGLDWQSDWETEISKGIFAAAFGNNVQPTEGDLVYIPMMKRMWMVNEAYEEKNDSLMWNATTFKVSLVKYQADGSLQLNDSQAIVDSVVKNKYEDLFSEDEFTVAQSDSAFIIPARPNDLYPVYESDAVRKYMTTQKIDFQNTSLYYKSTLITDNCYLFTDTTAQIIYQRTFCGDEGVISFIVNFNASDSNYNGTLVEIGDLKINYSYNITNKSNPKLGGKMTLTVFGIDNIMCDIPSSNYYFVYMRWSKSLNNIEFFVSQYKWPENIPIYKLSTHHYYFDIDNPIYSKITKYKDNIFVADKSEVILHGFDGTLTNFKLFKQYNDNLSEIMMQYPTNSNLIINDTAKQIVGLAGVTKW